MGLFDRKPTPQHARTEEERERARADRAARRAGKLGLDHASEPAPVELPPEDFGPYEGQVEAARALGVDPVTSEEVVPAPPADTAPEPPAAEPVVEPLDEPPDFAWTDRQAAAAEPTPPPPEPELPVTEAHEPPAPDPGPPTPAPVEAVAPTPAPVEPQAAAARAPRPRPATRPTPAKRPEPARTAARAPVATPAAAPEAHVREPASRYDAPSAVFDSPVAEDWSAVDEPFADGDANGRPPRRPRRAPKPARPPGDPGRPRRLGARILALAAIAGVLVAVWLLFSLFEPLKGDATGKVVTVSIPKGASVSEVGDILAKNDIVSSAFFFRLRSRISGKDTLIPGRYRLPQGMTYVAALDALAKGPPKPKTTPITISEGRTRKEASRLLKETSLKGNYYTATRTSSLLDPTRYGAKRGTKSLEGFLFPATYTVRVGAPVQDLVDQQLKTFKQRFGKVNLSYAKRKKLSAYDVLIIASMIEREVQLDRERPIVAAVIYNRLKIGYPLGIDATLRYALDDNESSLTQSQLDSNSPYNTRNRQGLPPTPIGNPGIKSIQAAANPSRNSKVLYFVVKPCANGAHAFSNTIEQFNADAAKYNAARDAKGGSPVKC